MKLLKEMTWNLIWYAQWCRVGNLGSKSKIHPAANLGGYAKNIHIGGSTEIRANATLLCENSTSRIVIGDRAVINSYVMVLTYGGNISIGDCCNINPFTVLYVMED